MTTRSNCVGYGLRVIFSTDPDMLSHGCSPSYSIHVDFISSSFCSHITRMLKQTSPSVSTPLTHKGYLTTSLYADLANYNLLHSPST